MGLTKKQRVRLGDSILAWYGENKRDLPWRRTDDPYRIWVSEVMLQQTQVDTVIPYYERFVRAFPSVMALAGASLQEVLKAWEGLGYYARARNLHAGARRIAADMGGRLPGSREGLLAIPGIGPYTAAAVASIAFNEDCAVVDGNVARLLARLFVIHESPAESSTKTRLNELAAELLPRGNAADFNQAMMELGAIVCKPACPECGRCPVASHCLALRTLADPSVLPVKKARRLKPHYDVAVGVVWKDAEILIRRRPAEGLLGGLWEFPGGTPEKNETLQACVERKIQNEHGIRVVAGEDIGSLQHAYTHFRITLHPFRCRYVGTSGTRQQRSHAWVTPAELAGYPFARANQRLIEKLFGEFK